MSLSRYFNRPRPIPFIMSVSAVILLFGLGIWQLDRLNWKEALIADIERATANAPLQTLPEDVTAHRFYRVQLQGEYLPEPEFHLAARYFQSKLGYSLLNPFKLTKGQIVMVSRGWVPAELKDKTPAAPSGAQTILAQIRTSDERNHFTPENQPEKNVWFGRDALQMGEHAKLKVLPITLDIIGEQDRAILPVPSNGNIKPRNDHLGYAVTWFGIGFAALIISLLYHRKKPANA
jgi:surfeit locus 1 family protein